MHEDRVEIVRAAEVSLRQRRADVRAVGLDILFQGSAGGDEALAPLLSRPNVILATTPDDPQGRELGPRL